MRRVRDTSGQAAAELVAVVPLAIVVVLALAQVAIAGFALWSAADAARAGARAANVGGDPEGAARSALPGWLERSAEVVGSGPIEVRVEAPALIPGVPSIPVRAAARLSAGVGTDG